MKGRVFGRFAAASRRSTRLRLPVFVAALLAGSVIFSAGGDAGAQTTSAITASPKQLAPGFDALPAGARIVLMPPDIELYSLSAGAVREPRADWTQAALAHFETAFAERNRNQGLATLVLDEDGAARFDEVVLLHEMVADAITRHHFGDKPLRAKDGQLDWSLGEAVGVIRDATGADYAFFVSLRDSYASPERIALLPLRLALGGLPYVGSQKGHASLVDLRTGRVVWFNHLQRASGSLRDLASARETIEVLLENFPATTTALTKGAGLPQAIGGILPTGRLATPPSHAGISLQSSLALSSSEAGLRFMTDRDEDRLKRSPFRIDDPKAHAYIRGIVCRLTPEHCNDIRVYLLRIPVFHASMAHNGALQVWSGLMLRMENEAQLAYVLAHEIAHFLKRHTLRKAEELKARSAIVEALGIFGEIGGFAEYLLKVHMAAHTREQEREADRMSLEIMQKAGYDAREAARVWANHRLQAEEHAAGGSNKPYSSIATHPSVEEREKMLTELFTKDGPRRRTMGNSHR